MTTLPAMEPAQPAASASAVDFSRRFMPESLTPLFYTAAYATLTAGQQCRYNQLNALYFNEQTVFFETALAQNVLGFFLAGSLPAKVRQQLEQFAREEREHTEMFRRLNSICAPEFYAGRDFHFIRVTETARRLLAAITRRPDWFPLLLWLMHLQEERALYFGRTFLQHSEELEPHFVATQRKHLADEAGHVRCDEWLLDHVWPRTSFPVRWVNARMLAWMLAEYFTVPKRAGVQVVAQLVAEFPELQPRQQELAAQLLGLKNDRAFCLSLYSPENASGTFRRFAAWPEFRCISRVLPGYQPEVVG